MKKCEQEQQQQQKALALFGVFLTLFQKFACESARAAGKRQLTNGNTGKLKTENRKLTTDWGTATAARTESRWPTENLYGICIRYSTIDLIKWLAVKVLDSPLNRWQKMAFKWLSEYEYEYVRRCGYGWYGWIYVCYNTYNAWFEAKRSDASTKCPKGIIESTWTQTCTEATQHWAGRD